MRARRDVALAVVAWVVVVVVCASLVWAVISRAGRGVAGDGDALPAAERSAPRCRGPRRRRSRRRLAPPARLVVLVPILVLPAGPARRGRATELARSGRSGHRRVSRRRPIRLTGATPNSGYAVEVDDSGPDRLRVEFESGDGDHKTRVEAECRGGVPIFVGEDRQGED